MILTALDSGLPKSAKVWRAWWYCYPVNALLYDEACGRVLLVVAQNFTYAIISFRAPMKLVALSLYIHAGFPRRAMNRFKADTQDGVDREETSSMWTAWVVKHTSNAMYAFPTDLKRF